MNCFLDTMLFRIRKLNSPNIGGMSISEWKCAFPPWMDSASSGYAILSGTSSNIACRSAALFVL